MDSKHVIYALTEPGSDTVRYIGLSNQGVRRARYPMNGSSAPKREWLRKLKARRQRHGYRVLETASSAAELHDLERYWIAQGRGLGWPLLNVSKGGYGPSGVGRKRPARSKDWIEKHAASLRGRSIWPNGRVMSDSHLAKLRAFHQRRASDPNWRAGHSAAMTGKSASPETRAKMSASQRARRAAERGDE